MAAYFFDPRYGVAQYTGVSSEFLELVERGPRSVRSLD
jgi:hypothetical protein